MDDQELFYLESGLIVAGTLFGRAGSWVEE
jgi:hypothetical protein